MSNKMNTEASAFYPKTTNQAQKTVPPEPNFYQP